MRNVLIYFEDAVKRRILAKVHDLLPPDGYLFLGGSETTLNLEDRLEQVQLERTRCFPPPALSRHGPVIRKSLV